ncbi:MAG: hypothetical protein EAZ97_05595 [Bacteroidetes bacterium]|nr:MAG: hypothetical protein EAZ97_05595 [Bacteroidota bacterium]
MKISINSSEIVFSNLSLTDEIGKVFFWENRVFRAIYSPFTDWANDLFSCGLMTELIEKQLVPNSKISNYTLEDFDLVLEHEKIEPVSYPYEWTFSMLQAAAVLVLEVNQIAQKYGYQTKDCHPFNVLFCGTKPVFIDIGSFVKREKDFKGWIAYEEFLKSYEYVLKIASVQDFLLTKRLSMGGDYISHESFYHFQYPFSRILSLDTLKKNLQRYFKFRRLESFESEKLRAKLPNFVVSIIEKMKKQKLIPFQKINFEQLRKKILGIKPPKRQTFWGNYHDLFLADGKLSSTLRFDRIIEIFGKHDIKTVFEVAGNQGVFANLMLQKLPLQHIICSDYDENAVDQMFLFAKKNKQEKLFPVLLNFFCPILTSFSKPPQERFKADLLVALAVTHHLILTQKIRIETIFENVKQYAQKYVAIEFMPLGLYDGKTNIPMPDWYAKDWFKSHFEKHFDLLVEEQLEANRILFFGKIR